MVVVPATRDRIELHPAGPGLVRTVRYDGIRDVMWARLLDDQRMVVSAREHGRPPRLFVGAVTGGRATPVTPEGRLSRPELVSREGWIFGGCGPQGAPCLYDVAGGPPRLVPADGLQPLAAAPGALLVQTRGASYPVEVERLDIATGRRTPFARIAPDDLVGADPIASFVTSDDGRTWAYTHLRRLSELYLVEGLR